MKLKNIVTCGKRLENTQKKDKKNMIAWIIYVIVALILCFILYIASQGISRGLEAKNNNKKNFIDSKKNPKKNISIEIKRLKKLHDEGVLSNKEFEIAKKKILG